MSGKVCKDGYTVKDDGKQQEEYQWNQKRADPDQGMETGLLSVNLEICTFGGEISTCQDTLVFVNLAKCH